MSADYSPDAIHLSRPHARVLVCATGERSHDVYSEPRAQAGHGDIRTDTTHTKFLRHMIAKANHARRVRFEILALCGESTVRTDEQQVFSDERIQRRDISGQLSFSEASLEVRDLRIGRAEEDS